MGLECGCGGCVSRYYKTRQRPGKRRAASGRRRGGSWSIAHVDNECNSVLEAIAIQA